MKLLWQIEEEDIQKVKSFYEMHKGNAFVLDRIERNVKKNIPTFTKELFWEAMISCLITTQQRSGPDSFATKFISTKPFPLSYQKCKPADTIQTTVEETITAGSLRRGKTIGKEVKCNFLWLEADGWSIIDAIVEDLTNNQTPEIERKSAETIIANMKGFGPKQSRNLLQSLGLTKYEIPVDSRITKWLTVEFGFPIKLSAKALSDENYYNFVLDGIQKICEASDILPCVLDAAIFSSFDKEWSKDKLVW